MPTPDPISIGVDTASGSTLTYAVLDHDLKPTAISEGEMDQLVDFVAAQPAAYVAINAPSHTSTGVIRKRLRLEKPGTRTLRGAEIRAAEADLRKRGIAVSATPSNPSLCPPWMQLGLSLYSALGARGFKAFPVADASHVYLETHPHAAFTVLLGCLPLPKPTLEGRLQRALLLFERGVRIHDPMSFLEEITRHRLLHGVLPTDLLLSPQHLDALVAAYVAWVASHRPAEALALGEKGEGSIVLPVSALAEQY